MLEEVRDEYAFGRETHGVFGTPTFVFPNGQSAYLKILPAPSSEEAVPLWEEFVTMVRDRPFLVEIKRTKKPE